MNSILEIKNLTKNFGLYQAVNDISINVIPGQIFGFLGPNGAGKTTTIKMIAGLLKADGGHVMINGLDLNIEPEICKGKTAYIPDRPYIYEKLTAREFLQFISSLYSISPEQYERNITRLLPLFDLEDWQDHLIESYSHGMRQKLIITSAFMLEAPLIIVDEPMVGLDPKSAKIVKELFLEFAANGGSIFLSTHSLEVAEELCDTIAIIVEGKIKTIGNLEKLRQESKLKKSGLEDIFLQLTGAHELQAVIAAIQGTHAKCDE